MKIHKRSTFVPKSDITPYELALLLATIAPGMRTDAVEKLPAEVRRHFVEETVGSNPAPINE